MKRSYNKYDLSNRRKRKKRSRLFFFLFLSLFFAGGFLFLIRTPEMRITEIKIESNNQNLSEEKREEIIKTIKNNINGNYFLIIPKNSIFFYPKQKLEQNLLESFPLMLEVNSIAYPWEGLSVELKTRFPYAVWCNNGECFLMDKDGFIFQKLPKQNRTEFYFSGLINGDPIKQVFGSATLINFLDKIIQDLNQLGMKTLEIEVKSVDEIKIRLENNSLIILSFSEEKDNFFISNLSLLIDSLKDKNMGMIPEFQYIDLRYGNKIFYKLQLNP